MTSNPMKHAYRASILHFIGDGDAQYIEDGLMVVEDGLVVSVGDAATGLAMLESSVEVQDFSGRLLMPGFIDTHIHYPQVDVIASYGEQLLDWLNHYTFPAELEFEDPTHARSTAQFFLNELLKNGTTSALVFGTKHADSVQAFFEASTALNTRMICGKVMMDRNAPEALCDDAQSSYDESQALIDQWHEKGRQLYAVTPRFAITSTPEQLQKAGELLQNNPSVYMQTHLSENQDEIAFTLSLFPDRKDYLDVYDHYGLLGPKSVFAHGVHLSDDEFQRLAATGSSISFCPTSNLFLGSGLFDLTKAQSCSTQVSVASDVGAGTSFSMLRTLSEAYKVCQLRNHSLDAKAAFYMATLGNAKTLQLDHLIGNFEAGKEADFIILDDRCTDLMARRQSKCRTLDERLFSLMMLGDDRAISHTFIAGQCQYRRDA